MIEFISKAREQGFTVYGGHYAGVVLKDSEGQTVHYNTIYEALEALEKSQ